MPVGPPGEADHGLGGRHPQLLHPRLPREGGRHPGTLQLAVVHGDEAGTLSPVLRRVLRHQALGDDRLGHRDGAGGLSRRGSAADRPTASPVAAGEKLFQDLACNTCHQPGPQGRGPVLARHLRQAGRAAGRRRRSSIDEAYLRESIVNPQAKVVAGFQPIMPTFQGLVTEEQLLQLIAYVQSLERSRAPRRTAHAADRRRDEYQDSYGNPELPQRRPRPQVVAVDERPQAHRAAVPRVDHRLLRDRRALRDVRSASSC